MKKSEIIQQMKDWLSDIYTDIESENILQTNADRFRAERQSAQLSMAIGLLQNLGENPNIEE